eukprot:1554745-Lingulodinium_polyedra.AAC.1
MSKPGGCHPEYHLLYADPLPLRKGEDSWPCWTACVEFFPSLKMMRHNGISIHQYSMDRKLYTSLGKSLSRRHKWLQKEFQEGTQMTEQEAKGAEYTSWQ